MFLPLSRRMRRKINCIVSIRTHQCTQSLVDFNLEFLEWVYFTVNGEMSLLLERSDSIGMGFDILKL